MGGVAREESKASMASLATTATQSTIPSVPGETNPWVDPSEGPEGAAFRFMLQVESYMARTWKDFDRHMRYLSRGMAPGRIDERGRIAKPTKVGVSKKQHRLMNEMRQAVGLHVNVKLAAIALSITLLGLLVLTVFLWLAAINVQVQIDDFTVSTDEQVMETPPSLELRLHRLTVPFGPTSTLCRSFQVNYTHDAHIVSFEARSLGYPFGAAAPADKIVRTMSLWVADPSYNATNDPGDSSNFECDLDVPAGAHGRLLWQWSRENEQTRWALPQSVGIRLPAVSQLFLQVTYDVETGSADLRQLSSFDFWDEFKPFDDSGIRINLVGNGQLQPNVATVVQVGTFDLNVPKLARSTHTTTCQFSAESPNFKRGAELTVFSAMSRTRDGGAAVTMDVTRDSGEAVWSSSSGGLGTCDAPPLPAHSALNPYFSSLVPTGGALGVEQVPLVLRQGDALRTTCEYNTRFGLPQNSLGGWGRGFEVCFVYLYVYPAEAVRHPYCMTYADEKLSSSSWTMLPDNWQLQARGAMQGSLRLDSNASAVDNEYKGMTIVTGGNVEATGIVTSYTGADQRFTASWSACTETGAVCDDLDTVTPTMTSSTTYRLLDGCSPLEGP